jgi:ketosteroid isomerase-like protein
MRNRPLTLTLASMAAFIGVAVVADSTAVSGPGEAVAAFHAALARGDRAAALDLLLPSVSIYEGGEAEISRDEYAAEHLAADMEFTKATQQRIDSREVHEAGDAAWVLTRSHTTGTFRDRAVRTVGAETMVLQRSPEGWRIAHVHWSSHSLRE